MTYDFTDMARDSARCITGYRHRAYLKRCKEKNITPLSRNVDAVQIFVAIGMAAFISFPNTFV